MHKFKMQINKNNKNGKFGIRVQPAKLVISRQDKIWKHLPRRNDPLEKLTLWYFKFLIFSVIFKDKQQEKKTLNILLHRDKRKINFINPYNKKLLKPQHNKTYELLLRSIGSSLWDYSLVNRENNYGIIRKTATSNKNHLLCREKNLTCRLKKI